MTPACRPAGPAFDPGHPSRGPRHVVRLVVHTVALAGAVAAVLVLQSWWASVVAALAVGAVAQSVEPATATEAVATSVDDAKSVLHDLGYRIAPAGDAAASVVEQSSVYPLIQPVDLRARPSSVELAVSVYDDKSGPVDWTTASRLVSAARLHDPKRPLAALGPEELETELAAAMEALSAKLDR